jgi:3-carboxy-cis,cis-muconate cycloisomerase
MAEPINALFSTPMMSAILSPGAHVRYTLIFESALARASARAGIVPLEIADAIATNCREKLFDVAALYREAAIAGTPPYLY